MINNGINLDDEISFVNYGGMLIYGSRNSGKTFEILKILGKYSYVYVDMRLYGRLYGDKLKAAEHIVGAFAQLNPRPLFLLIREGIQFYSVFHNLGEENVRVVFVESDLKYCYFSLVNDLVVLDYDKLV